MSLAINGIFSIKSLHQEIFAIEQMNLAVVIVTYNRLEQIKTTLQRLFHEPVDRIVIVDNGSSDGTRSYLDNLSDSRLDIHYSESNLGGAGGFEFALRHVVKTHDPDWVLIMDDDARPEIGAISKFRSSDRRGWDAIAAAVYYPDGRICAMNRPVLNPFKHPLVFFKTAFGGGRAAFHLKDADYKGEDPIPVDGASFVGLFISREGIRMAGYPDGRLFVYGEDGLYTLGLTNAGGKLAFFPDVHFEHDCSTFLTSRMQFSPPWKAYYYYRNLLLLYRKAAGVFFWPALLIILPKWFLRVASQGENKRAYLHFLGRAVRDGLTGRFGYSAHK